MFWYGCQSIEPAEQSREVVGTGVGAMLSVIHTQGVERLQRHSQLNEIAAPAGLMAQNPSVIRFPDREWNVYRDEDPKSLLSRRGKAPVPQPTGGTAKTVALDLEVARSGPKISHRCATSQWGSGSEPPGC